MYYYKDFDLKVKSDLKFSQLILCDDEKQCDLEIVSGEMPQDILEKSEEKRQRTGASPFLLPSEYKTDSPCHENDRKCRGQQAIAIEKEN